MRNWLLHFSCSCRDSSSVMKKQLTLLSAALAFPLYAQPHDHVHGIDGNCEICHNHANEVRFLPFFSTAFAVGDSTGDEHLFEETNHHDPKGDGFHVQSVEAGGSMKVGDDFLARAIYSTNWASDTQWDGHWEEAYMKVNLTDRFSLLAGQYFPSVTEENLSHSHSRRFVEGALAHSRFYGEDNLLVAGAELSYQFAEKSHISLGFGSTAAHDHGEEEEHEDSTYHGHEGVLAGELFHGRIQHEWHGHTFGAFGVYGENGFDRDSRIVGLDWRHSFDIAGKKATAGAELMHRKVDAIAEADGARGSFDETTLNASLRYEIHDIYSIAARAEWLSGDDAAGLQERGRLAANITRYDSLNNDFHSATRLQYTADFLPGSETESTVWLQWVLEFGGH